MNTTPPTGPSCEEQPKTSASQTDEEALNSDVQHSEPGRLAPNRHEYHSSTRNVKHDTSTIGIDTIKLMPKNCTVSKEAPLTVLETSDFSTGEVYDVPLLAIEEEERIAEAGKAFHNGDKVQITINSVQEHYVQACLPKMFGPDNLQPVDTAVKFYRAVQRLENKLSEIGINADLMDSKISRIDICRNIVTKSPLANYHSVLQELEFPRMTSFRDGNNPGWKNGTRQLLIYDKGNESNLDTDRLQRCEYRLMKARGVRNHLGWGTPAELSRHFGAVPESFKSAIKTLIPSQQSVPGEASRLTQDGIEAAFDALSGERTQVSNTLHAIALHYLRKRDDVGSFQEAVRNEKGRQSARRYQKKFEELGPVADLLSERERTTTEMKKELRGKLLA